jgi:hypothetical protein
MIGFATISRKRARPLAQYLAFDQRGSTCTANIALRRECEG